MFNSLLKASGYCLAIFPFSILEKQMRPITGVSVRLCVFDCTVETVTYLILLKILSRSFFISTRVRVWSKKRSFICCSRTLDSPLKLISISLVFSKRSSLFSK